MRVKVRVFVRNGGKKEYYGDSFVYQPSDNSFKKWEIYENITALVAGASNLKGEEKVGVECQKGEAKAVEIIGGIRKIKEEIWKFLFPI